MIRSARSRDADAISELSRQLGYPTTSEEVESRLALIETRGDGRAYVAEIEGAVVGWVHVFGAHTLESPAHAEIGGLVVDEAHRGRGVGRALMDAAEGWAGSMRYATVRLRSNVIREGAHRFYEQVGYRPSKRQQVFTKDIAAVPGTGDRDSR